MSQTSEDFWKLSDSPEHLPDQAICTTKSRVDLGSNTNQSTWDSKLQVVTLGVQRDNSTEDGFAFVPTLCVLRYDTRSNLNLLTEPQDTGEDRAASDTTLQVVNFGTGFIDIE